MSRAKNRLIDEETLAWLGDDYCSADVAESAYNMAREHYRGQYPKHLKAPWHLTNRSYRETLIFMVDHAVRAGQRNPEQEYSGGS